MSQCPFARLHDPETFKNGIPFEGLKKIRDEQTIVKLEDDLTGIPYWVISKREHIDFVSKNPQLFSSAMRTAFPMEFLGDEEWVISEILNKQIINMDAPAHIKYRKIVKNIFTPKAIDALVDVYRAHAQRIVETVAKKGECDFVKEVAAELPLIAILELLNVPIADREKFFNWTNTMMFADDPDMSTSRAEGEAAAAEVCNYALNLALEHRANPKDDLIGKLLEGEVDGEGLSEEEFMWFFVLLLVAGNESTRSVIANGMRLLIEHPDQLQLLVEDPSLIPGTVEEILRLGTAFISMRRTATEDIVLGGKTIKKGDKVLMYYHSAGQDEDVFGEDSASFDVLRAQKMPELKNEHRSFGIGQHFCLGSHLARREVTLMFEFIIPMLRNPRFVEQPKFVRSYFVNSPKELKIAFDPMT